MTRLDHCNSSLAILPPAILVPLQSVQNAVVRLIFHLKPCDHPTASFGQISLAAYSLQGCIQTVHTDVWYQPQVPQPCSVQLWNTIEVITHSTQCDLVNSGRTAVCEWFKDCGLRLHEWVVSHSLPAAENSRSQWKYRFFGEKKCSDIISSASHPT